MSLNWKEIELIIRENDITGSKIQAVFQNSFHALTWEMYKTGMGRFLYYTEVGTETSGLYTLSTDKVPVKTKKLQRFVQFARKNIEGAIIEKIEQLQYDRCVIWHLNNHGRILKVFIRLYSGPGANIIVTDEEYRILDLLLRRPGREEISGKILNIERRTDEGEKYEIRPYEGSFNSFIEKSLAEARNHDVYQSLLFQLESRKEHELSLISKTISNLSCTIENYKDYDQLKYDADLLSSNAHLIKQGDSSVRIHDWTRDCDVTVTIDRSLSAGANISAYYDRYQKAKGTYENAVSELERMKKEYVSVEEKFNNALLSSDNRGADIRRIKFLLEKPESAGKNHEGPGIRCFSGGFEIIAGRNAKENDELLRHYAKGNDIWMHTRDFPGGYVFIKYNRGKTVPLDVLLDAANLAVLFSKGKNNSSVDLYYTQVRYLRRAKNGKTGLVLPTQEKNLTIRPDRKRTARLLPIGEKNDIQS